MVNVIDKYVDGNGKGSYSEWLAGLRGAGIILRMEKDLACNGLKNC